MSLPLNVNNLLDFTGKLAKLKHGPTTTAIANQQRVLTEAKHVLQWFQELTVERQGEMLDLLVEPVGKMFKRSGQRLLIGPTVVIPRPNATQAQAAAVRKAFTATVKVLKAAEASAAAWQEEDDQLDGEDDPSSEEEQDKDSPVKRKRPAKDILVQAKRKQLSPGSSPRKAKALVRVRAAYRVAMALARELETVPHAFGDELEWNIRPRACPVLTEHAQEDNEFATLEDIETASGLTPALLDGYVSFLRRSAVVWHAHLRKCPTVNLEYLTDPRKDDWLVDVPRATAKDLFGAGAGGGEKATFPNNDSIGKQEDIKMVGDKLFHGDFYAADGVRRATGAMAALNLNVSSGLLQGLNLALPMPVETEDYREMFQLQDGKVLTRPPKTYTREEFCYRLLAFARSMPDSVDREIHFYHMYVIDLFTKLDLYDVKCVAEYDKYIRQRLATNFITSWNPDMLVGTWNRFIQSRKEAGNSAAKTPRSKASDAAAPTPRTPKPGLHCFPWNAGKCSKKNRKFPHTCSSCGGNHRKTECKQK
ncbi:hypothetical protein CYMTET_10778 [Cymbomonas tetramitiformis]|uniref:Uncharacterized protein n=1 Tax=Cymbomonas tetramitiformis TaxID=36881 RepID=A0AAE0GNQ6_9CHLO|nr:hypothetical protein CYMTET_10778 [Cymbomonas tetramitiformis]